MLLVHKTMLVLGLASVASFALLYFGMATVVHDGFDAIENAAVERALHRVQSALGQELELLSSKVSDRAANEDPATLVEHALRLPAGDTDRETIVGRRPDFAVVVEAAGAAAQGLCVDAAGAVVALPAGLAAHLQAARVLQHLPSDSLRKGILRCGDRLALVCARPLAASTAGAEARGTLVLGRFADAQLAADIGQLTESMVAFLPAGEAGLGSTFAVAGADLVVGTLVLPDLDGQPALAASVRQSRDLHAAGEQLLRLLLLSLLGVGSLALFGGAFGLRRLVLARLLQLRNTAHAITASGDPGLELPAVGSDEIGSLAADFNAVLRRLRASNDDLLRANQQRSAFLANVSHEIRTPLNAVIGFADLLLLPDIAAERRLDYVQTIRRNGQHLLAMLNDLLDISKIEAGQMTVERVACAVAPLLAEVISLMQPQASNKGLWLQLEQTGPVPAAIHTDPTRLKQVLLNLVGNAIKFTDLGGVRIVAGMAGPQQLQLAVTDTGIGMSEAQQRRLFVAFAQADSSTTRRFGGTGLGLALCQQLTRLLGGEVTCSSVLDEGSTFSVVVATGPLDGVRMLTSLLAESRQRRDAKAVPPRLPHELRDRRILLADDAPDNQRLVAFLLRKAGAEVEIVGDGQMAADRILGELHQRRPFDLVVMDMQMPLMDGYAATSLVRERGFRGPIVALTAHAMSGDREMCLQAGCTEYLAKPIDHAQLIAVVAALVASAPAPSPAGP